MLVLLFFIAVIVAIYYQLLLLFIIIYCCFLLSVIVPFFDFLPIFLFLSIKPQNNKNVIKHENRHLQLSQLTFTVKPIDTYYLLK